MYPFDILQRSEHLDREARAKAISKNIGEGKASIREVKRRQVFVGDVPVGDAFE